MSDLISRSALIEYLEKVTVTEGITFETGFKQILTDIRNQPTVEAKPVVHGEWIDTCPDCHSGFRNNAHKCSICGDYYTTEPEDLFLCPRCGADMRGGKNE